MTFQDLKLAKPILRAIELEGYSEPTPIQEKSIPVILEGRDVLGCAQTGTGKTGAFAMPILHRLAENMPAPKSREGQKQRGKRGKTGRHPSALVLCPTRELASQIHESFTTYGKKLHLDCTTIFGGVSQHWQVRALNSGVDIAVATPGRLLDLMNQGLVNLKSVEFLVLDEADRMLDMGFIDDIRKIIKRLPIKRQTLLFSATMPNEIRKLSDSILHDPEFIKVDPVASPAEMIKQSVYMVPKNQKPNLITKLLKEDSQGRTLIFTRTKHGADRLVKILRKSDIDAAAIHGNKTQNARTRALGSFKTGRVPILIATDIASRGIDVDEITHVFNYDLPNVAETYLHRIGRTARAGASGTAISFCDEEQVKDLRAIERLMEMSIDIATDDPEFNFEPSGGKGGKKSRRKSNRGSGGGGKRSSSGSTSARKPRARGRDSEESDRSRGGKGKPKSRVRGRERDSEESDRSRGGKAKPKSRVRGRERDAEESDRSRGGGKGKPKPKPKPKSKVKSKVKPKSSTKPKPKAKAKPKSKTKSKAKSAKGTRSGTGPSKGPGKGSGKKVHRKGLGKGGAKAAAKKKTRGKRPAGNA